jgi:SpoVK/Ycf46/Vps4 family AAA+-type ATPase
MRPGRLDRILWVGPPDRPGREEILKIKTMKMSVASDLDIGTIAELVSVWLHCLGLIEFYQGLLSLDRRLFWC